MATFNPRTSVPNRSSAYYDSGSPFKGDISMWSGGNCTAYAWGRFHEVLGSTSDRSGCWLPTYNAEDWFPNVRGYKTGKTPKLGAVICYADGPYSGVGHVAVVERINADGSILISESGYKSFTFRTKTERPPYYNTVGYRFQGFIYNPAVPDNASIGGVAGTTAMVNAPEVFLAEFRKHIGPQGHAWVMANCNIGYAAWCAATVCCVAKAVGYAPTILPKPNWGAYCVNEVAIYAVGKGGTYIKGPRRGNAVKPSPGDLILFDWNNGYTTKYGADHIGVVEKVVGDVVHTIEGNTSNTYARKTYNYTSRLITYYIRPNWSLVGGVATNIFGNVQPLYTTRSTRADATIREVGYMSTAGKVAVKSGGYELSVVNYTSLLGAIVDTMGGASSGFTGDADTSGITNATARSIIDYIIAKGLTPAAACGIAGNIQAESGFNPGAVEMGPPYEGRGLCQWSFSRRVKMIGAVGPTWASNLTGQLDFMWKELESGYKNAVLTPLMNIPNTEEGCKKAADIVVRKYLLPGQIEAASLLRQKYAAALWNKIRISSSSTAGVSNGSTNISGPVGTIGGRSLKKSISIPSNLSQTGLISDYTPIEGFNWAYNQGRVFKVWRGKGSKSNKGIATIDGYYLVAVRQKFGNVGDLIQIVLKNNVAINAVIMDIKGSDAADWGHKYGNSYSLIEWEKVNGVSQQQLNSNLGSWYGKEVARIDNYGSYA